MEAVKIESSYQMSPMQQGMLFHSLYARQSGVYIQQLVCCLNEDLDVAAFQRAWQRLANRHPSLRTGFRWEGLREPLQEVHSQISLPFEIEDWRGLSKGEQEARLDAYLEADQRHDFVFSEPPLLRLALFRAAEASYRFVWTSHHGLLDGRSRLLLIKECFEIYAAERGGFNLSLSQPRPYQDHIEWLQRQDWTGAEAFWRERMKGFKAPTPLIQSLTCSPATNAEQYGEQTVKLSPDVTTALRSFVQQHELTLNLLLQGIWALLLSRYSGEEDVVFGTTRACRKTSLSEAETMIGLFINTVPVRVCISPEMRVVPWLKELRGQQLGVREHEHTPLQKIQEWSEIPRGARLFDSLLVFENYQVNELLQAQGGAWKNRAFRLSERTNYPLTLAGYAGPELSLKLAYDRERFDEETITRMLGHCRVLLESVVDNVDQKIRAWTMLTAAEEYLLLSAWNQTQATFPSQLCIHHLFESQAARTPHAIAVSDAQQRLSYLELNQQANLLAQRLQALGVGPEVRVAVLMPRSAQMLVCLLAVLKAGGAYLPLDSNYPRERLRYMMADSGALVVMTINGLQEQLPESEAEVLLVDEELVSAQGSGRKAATQAISEVEAANAAYMIYTSGSTGKPKGVVIEHASAVAFLHWARDCFTPEDLAGVLASTSICFDLSIFEIFAPLSWGGKVILADNALSLTNLPDAAEVSLINTVPSAMTELLRLGVVPSSVRQVNLAGEVLPAGLVKQIYDETGAEGVWNLYGPSESTTYSTFSKVPRGGDKPLIGRPIANTQLYVLSKHAEVLPVGVAGDLFIAGNGLARGYLHGPALTAERFVPNPFSSQPGARMYHTGDVVRYAEDGQLEFLGRADHQVKLRGFRIEPGEIEAILASHRAVRSTVVLVHHDQLQSPQLVAYCVLDGSISTSTRELRQYLSQHLPDYMLPNLFVLLEEMPLTPNGKVNRHALLPPSASAAVTESCEQYVEPRTDAEQVVAAIWREVLGVQRVGVADNFFELGGHSLIGTQVITRLREALGVEVSLRNLFERPTVEALVQKMVAEESKAGVTEKRAMLVRRILQMSADDVRP